MYKRHQAALAFCFPDNNSYMAGSPSVRPKVASVRAFASLILRTCAASGLFGAGHLLWQRGAGPGGPAQLRRARQLRGAVMQGSVACVASSGMHVVQPSKLLPRDLLGASLLKCFANIKVCLRVAWVFFQHEAHYSLLSNSAMRRT